METRARLPADFIESVKQRTDIVALIQQDLPLKRSGGKAYYACCPFHAERTPSFAVDQARGTYLCRGCDAKGDAIKWLTTQRGMTFWDALTLLATAAGIPMPTAERTTPVDRENAKIRNGLYTVLQQAASLYSYGLDQHRDAQAYLELRGVAPETAKRFGVGYVRSGIRSVLAKRVKNPAWITEAGVVNATADGREVELLRHRITIALRNERGVVVGFSGRIMDGVYTGPKYLNSPETQVFHKSRELFGLDLARAEIIKRRSVILVEGYFDVMRLHQSGDARAVAAMGTSLSAEQAARLLRDVDVLYLCLDGDAAGQRATVRTAQVLLRKLRDGQEIRVVQLPGGCDPDEFLKAEGVQAWNDAVDESQRLSDFVVSQITEHADASSAESIVSSALALREWLSLCEYCPLYAQALRVTVQRRLGIEL